VNVVNLQYTFKLFYCIYLTVVDPSLPLVVDEYTEWGNPQFRGDYKKMIQYAPYENIKAQDYPSMMIRSNMNDKRVMVRGI
jgi:oligopeptidase B